MEREHESDTNRNGRPEYAKPVVVSLGALERGAGAVCANGSSATTSCDQGSSPAIPGQCRPGLMASGNQCRPGGFATVQCRSGGIQ